ncbi:MAG: hypothetical protein KatS3mg081_2508 [Gemmatimonadales bacterium]|nr:MAG: hypothetical protein KatS3mg081_2508 [Gemmatimonadales bacterium]
MSGIGSRWLTTVLAWLLLVPAGAAAHEKGVLKLERRDLTPGESVRLAGEKFGKGASLRLVLVGTGGRIELGSVRTDSTGKFETALAVPEGIDAGSYRLVAIASDGDEVAALDVTLVAGGAEHSLHSEAGNANQPSSEPLRLNRARSVPVTAGALLVIAAAVFAGIALLRRPGGA